MGITKGVLATDDAYKKKRLSGGGLKPDFEEKLDSYIDNMRFKNLPVT